MATDTQDHTSLTGWRTEFERVLLCRARLARASDKRRFKSGPAASLAAANTDSQAAPTTPQHASTQNRLAAQVGGIAANFSCVFADGTRAADFRRIPVPTLMLRGSESPSTVACVADRITAALPDAEQRTIAGAGHMLPVTHAAVVAAAVTEHCEACATAEAA